MRKCPKCGSVRIAINGVLQKKKGAMYYLSGQFATEAGMRHGSAMVNALRGNKNNAVCMDCHYEWHAGKNGAAAVAPAPVSATAPTAPTQKPAARFCRKCGAPTEPGDVYCIQCGTKL